VLRRELDISGSRWNPVVSCCEHGNEFSSSVTVKEFPEWLIDSQLLKMALFNAISVHVFCYVACLQGILI
jgi:hypothetical protein